MPKLCEIMRFMPKTVTVRNIDDKVYAVLRQRAAAARISVPELLRRAAIRLATRQSMEEWLNRTARGPTNPNTTEQGIDDLDSWRGPWPDAGN